MEDGVDEERPGHGDWTGGSLGKPRIGLCRGHEINCSLPSAFLPDVVLRGTRTPGFAYSVPQRAEDSLC
jgi:hypothetical protein